MKILILLVAVVFVAGCNAVDSNTNTRASNTANTTTPASQIPHADVKRITTNELETLIKEDKAVVVDVRNKAMYDQGHIRGAKLIPVGEVGARANELPRDNMIVTYCS